MSYYPQRVIVSRGGPRSDLSRVDRDASSHDEDADAPITDRPRTARSLALAMKQQLLLDGGRQPSRLMDMPPPSSGSYASFLTSKSEPFSRKKDAQILSSRKASRLTRDKPWQKTSSQQQAMHEAIQQTQPARPSTAGRVSTAAPSQFARPSTAFSRTGNHAAAVPPNQTTPAAPVSMRPATAAYSRRGTVNTTILDSNSPHTHPPSSSSGALSSRTSARFASALAASMATLQSSQFLSDAQIQQYALDRLEILRQEKLSQQETSFAESDHVEQFAPASNTYAAVPKAGYAQPTAASLHHHRPPSSSPRASSSVRSSNASALMNHTPASIEPPHLSPCQATSILRLTLASTGRQALTQHQELKVLKHDARTIQFASEENSASSIGPVKYRARWPTKIPPANPLFEFDAVIPARLILPNVSALATAVHLQDQVFQCGVRENLEDRVFACFGVDRASGNKVEPVTINPLVVLSIGSSNSGKSYSLFGPDTTAASNNNPSSAAAGMLPQCGLIERSLQALQTMLQSIPKRENALIGVSMVVLLASSAQPSGGHLPAAQSGIDLLASTYYAHPHSSSIDAEYWRQTEIKFDTPAACAPVIQQAVTSLGNYSFQTEMQGPLVREFASAGDAFQTLMNARRLWLRDGLPIFAQSSLTVGSTIVSIHVGQRAKVVDASHPSNMNVRIVRSIARFVESPACMREWALAHMQLNTAITDLTASRKSQLKELDEIHKLLQLRATAEASASNNEQRIECNRNASTLSRIVLAGLNPGSSLLLLTHVSIRGATAAGSHVVQHMLQTFGRPAKEKPLAHMQRDDEEEEVEEEERREEQVREEQKEQRPHTAGAHPSTVPMPPSLLCKVHPFTPFLVERMYPAVAQSLPKLYAPLVDIVFEYLGAEKNLSFKRKQKSNQPNSSIAELLASFKRKI